MTRTKRAREAPQDPLIALGLSPEGATEARALAARDREIETQASTTAWAWGDLLVRELGPSTQTTYINDGSRALLRPLAAELDVSVKHLSQWRSTATAWPPDTRFEGVAWGTHRVFTARPNRVELMTAFVEWCAEVRLRPADYTVQGWLAQREGRPLSEAATERLSNAARTALGLDDKDSGAVVPIDSVRDNEAGFAKRVKRLGREVTKIVHTVKATEMGPADRARLEDDLLEVLAQLQTALVYLTRGRRVR